MLHLYKINTSHTFLSSSTLADDRTLGRALTLGNFDGVHLGHQAILKQLRSQAQQLGLKTTVVILEPQPREYFHQRTHMSHKPPVRILPLYDKLRRLSQMDIDEVAVLHFHPKVATLSASAFLEKWLLNHLNMRYLLTGNDFCFGQARKGNVAFLQQAAQQYGFVYETIDNINDMHHLRYSSSRIRDALAQGEFATAANALGEDYQISGRVHRGQGLAGQWKTPTANLHFRQRLPLSGIFAGFTQFVPSHLSAVQDEKGLHMNTRRWSSVIYIGNRSSTESGGQEKLETHLFDWKAEAFYGCRLKVQFLQKIRDNQHFDDLHLLRQRIELDLLEAKKIGLERQSIYDKSYREKSSPR